MLIKHDHSVEPLLAFKDTICPITVEEIETTVLKKMEMFKCEYPRLESMLKDTKFPSTHESPVEESDSTVRSVLGVRNKPLLQRLFSSSEDQGSGRSLRRSSGVCSSAREKTIQACFQIPSAAQYRVPHPVPRLPVSLLPAGIICRGGKKLLCSGMLHAG